MKNRADVSQHNLIQEGAVLLKKDDDAEYLMYLSAHHELVASALAVKAAHEINPDLQVGCMISLKVIQYLTLCWYLSKHTLANLTNISIASRFLKPPYSFASV